MKNTNHACSLSLCSTELRCSRHLCCLDWKGRRPNDKTPGSKGDNKDGDDHDGVLHKDQEQIFRCPPRGAVGWSMRRQTTAKSLLLPTENTHAVPRWRLHIYPQNHEIIRPDNFPFPCSCSDINMGVKDIAGIDKIISQATWSQTLLKMFSHSGTNMGNNAILVGFWFSTAWSPGVTSNFSLLSGKWSARN